jgi:phosphoglycerate dehydrogenase-like enzyme
MDHFAGMDVSVKETSVCILDDVGKIVKEVKVASEPQALLKVLGNPAYRFKRIGLEAGSTAPATAPFRSLSNVIMTPHVSGWTQGMLEARANVIANNIERTARGEAPLNALRRSA